jgi:epoxyqueuosine reductase
MALTQDLKLKVMQVGFVSVGISNPSQLRGLPYGWVGKVSNLRSPEELLPTVKSVILMGFNAWDRAFNLAVDSPDWKGYGMHTPDQLLERYQFYYEIMENKAWRIVDYLGKRGFESLPSFGIPLKTAAVKCGLGCQGKNTLLVTPGYGPRVRLISVLTTAELDIDEPYKEDLCGDCENCVVACPTKALEPYKLKINRCMTYSAESPNSSDVTDDVRKLERRLIEKPTQHSYIECTICIDVCPIGKQHK